MLFRLAVAARAIVQCNINQGVVHVCSADTSAVHIDVRAILRI